MDAVEVEAHPPERGGQSLILASGCCTTCCCCSCCLHSVGAVAGAAVGMSLALDSRSRAPSPPGDGEQGLTDGAATKTPPLAPGAVVIGFWALTAVMTAAALGLASSDLEVAGLVLAVLYPLLLSLVLLVVLPLALLAGPRGMAVWAKLAVGLIVGTVAGGAVMVVVGPALVMFL